MNVSAKVSRPLAGFENRLAPLLLLLVLLTAIRIATLLLSATDIQIDEAQYWDWSRHFAFGYYSKPPLIAWVIGIANGVCGTGVACVRLPASLFYFVTPLLIYATARRLYDRRVAFWAAAGFALAPGISFSASIMSTDVLLLFFMAWALLAFVRLRAGGGYGDTLSLAVALGLGLLAKYAMIYFLGCALIAAWLDPQSRQLIASRRFWLGLGLGLLFLVPNFIWNLQNHFVTFLHTSENISSQGGPRFHPGEALAFLASQFGVIGPVLFAGALAAAWVGWRRGASAADRLLLAFSLPIILVVAIAGMFNSANANWGAAALVATAIVGSAFWVRLGAYRWLQTGLIIGVVAQAVLSAAAPFAKQVTLPFVKHGDIYRQVLGWSGLADDVRAQAAADGAKTVVALDRGEAATLNYYLRNDPVTIAVWPDDPTPDDHFELTRSVVDHPPQGSMILVAGCADAQHLRAYFATVEDRGEVTIASGPTSWRHYRLFHLDHPTAPPQPVPLCVADHD